MFRRKRGRHKERKKSIIKAKKKVHRFVVPNAPLYQTKGLKPCVGLHFNLPQSPSPQFAPLHDFRLIFCCSSPASPIRWPAFCSNTSTTTHTQDNANLQEITKKAAPLTLACCRAARLLRAANPLRLLLLIPKSNRSKQRHHLLRLFQ